MKIVFLIAASLSIAGCAHRTIHERCSDSSMAGKYRDYDQCYSELSKAPQKGFLQALGENMQKDESPRRISCTTQRLGSRAYTNCQ